MSNAIAYDPILVRHLADELDGRLRGRACGAALVFPGQRAAVLPLDGGEALSLELHPARGWIRVVPWTASDELDARCVGVSAPADERRLVVALQVTDRFDPGPREIQIELQGNQWNALLLDAAHRILSLTWTRRAGSRELRTGATYHPPASSYRFGATPVPRDEAWRQWEQTLRSLDREDRTRAMLAVFAHTGTLNTRWIIDADRGPDGLERAFERWWWLATEPEIRPVVLQISDRTLPYPFPLEGTPAQPVGSLLEGIERVAASPAPAGTPAGPRDEEVAGAARRLDAARRRVRRLRAALQRGPGAEEIRARADLLLARLHLVTRGAVRVALEGWEGDVVEIELDPTRSPAENAAAIYETARRRGRAEARLPGMIDEAEAEAQRWEDALGAAEAGTPLPDWAIRALDSDTVPGPGQPAEAAHPYRVYRTSGGLEVRVGRSARDNDRLTFRSSSPDDVWLHARSVPGSHVILRWPQTDGSPPARDLEEAAGLAALFSRARTSALVPVDWTRRKHVRKPRGAPPGAVIPQRVKTLFVEPDPALAERLRRD